MKKFQYRLQRILKLKTTLKKQAQKILAKAQNEKLRQQTILENLRNELAFRLSDEKNSRSSILNVRHLELAQGYFSQLSFLISHQQRVVNELDQVVEKKRGLLVEASREERKYERLKEIRKEEYTQELELALQKETDEFAKNIHLQNEAILD